MSDDTNQSSAPSGPASAQMAGEPASNSDESRFIAMQERLNALADAFMADPVAASLDVAQAGVDLFMKTWYWLVGALIILVVISKLTKKVKDPALGVVSDDALRSSRKVADWAKEQKALEQRRRLEEERKHSRHLPPRSQVKR